MSTPNILKMTNENVPYSVLAETTHLTWIARPERGLVFSMDGVHPDEEVSHSLITMRETWHNFPEAVICDYK